MFVESWRRYSAGKATDFAEVLKPPLDLDASSVQRARRRQGTSSTTLADAVPRLRCRGRVANVLAHLE